MSHVRKSSTLSFSFDDAFLGWLLAATWTVRGSNPHGRNIIRTLIREAHKASCTGSFPGSKRPGRRADYPPSSSAEGANVLELYLCLPCVPLCACHGGDPLCFLGRESGQESTREGEGSILFLEIGFGCSDVFLRLFFRSPFINCGIFPRYSGKFHTFFSKSSFVIIILRRQLTQC